MCSFSLWSCLIFISGVFRVCRSSSDLIWSSERPFTPSVASTWGFMTDGDTSTDDPDVQRSEGERGRDVPT